MHPRKLCHNGRFPLAIKDGALLELLKESKLGQEKTINRQVEIFDITGHKVGFYEGHIVETLSDFEWPSFLENTEQDNLKELVQRIGIEQPPFVDISGVQSSLHSVRN